MTDPAEVRQGAATPGDILPDSACALRNTSGRAGWRRLGPVVTMRSRSLGRVSECWYYARNRDCDSGPLTTFEPSIFARYGTGEADDLEEVFKGAGGQPS